VCADDNIDETYGINVQFEESEEEVCFFSCCCLILREFVSTASRIVMLNCVLLHVMSFCLVESYVQYLCKCVDGRIVYWQLVHFSVAMPMCFCLMAFGLLVSYRLF